MEDGQSFSDPIQKDPLYYNAPLIILLSHAVVLSDSLDVCF